MAGYSMDLRLRIVEAYDNGEDSVRGLARRFSVSPRTVSRYLKLHRQTGSVSPAVPRKKGPEPKLSPNVVQELWEARPDATEAELVTAIAARTGVTVHRATVGRMLKKLGLTRKKNVHGHRAE